MSLLSIFIALITLSISAGSRIEGYVIDDSGTPVEGATVEVFDTSVTSTTDASGWFSIRLEPGMYTIAFGGRGYLEEIRREVAATDDEITRMEIHLIPDGETHNLTTDAFTLCSQNRSMDEISRIIRRHAGIVCQESRNGSLRFLEDGSRNPLYEEFSAMDSPVFEDELHIRGGIGGGLLYLVDGVDFREPLFNTPLGSVPSSSIGGSGVSSGAYDAACGGYLSGVAAMETREGGDEYSGEVRLGGNDWHALGLAEEGKWGGLSDDDPDEWRHSGVTPFNEARLELGGSVGGPEPVSTYLLPKIGMAIPGEMRFFMDGEFLETGGGKDGRYGFGFDEWETTYRGFLKLTYRPSPSTDINLSSSFLERSAGWFGAGNTWDWSRYSIPLIDEDTSSSTYGDTLSPGGNILYALPTRNWSNRTITASLDQDLGGGKFAGLAFSQLKWDYRHRIYNDPESSDPGRQTEWLGEDRTWADWNNYQTGQLLDDYGFVRDGTSRFPWLESRSTTNIMELRTEVPAWGSHLLGWGVTGEFHDVYSRCVSVDTSGGVHQMEFSARPFESGIFIQDLVNFHDGMHLSGGIRLDYFDPSYDREGEGTGTPQTPPDSLQYLVLDGIEAPPKYRLNPRVSFHMPIIESQILHISYGSFSQPPSFRYLYHPADYSYSQDVPLGGNPDLDLQVSNMYELGLTYLISPKIELDVTGFFRDLSGLVETGIYSYPVIGEYAQYTSSGTAESRGLEVSFQGSDLGFFSCDIAYTLSRSTGSSSHPLQNYFYYLNGLEASNDEQELDWDQRHTASVDVALEVPMGRGVRLGGLYPFQGMTVTIGWDWGSGFPFTYLADLEASQVEVNGYRYPATHTVDLKIDKEFPLGTFTMNAWCGITNLFNRRNLVGIQDIHWSWFDWNSDGPGEGIEYPGGPLDDPYVYSIPRMIRFGLGLNW